MRFNAVLLSILVIASAACGKGKEKEGGSGGGGAGGGGGGGGPACSEAAAAYVAAHANSGGNKIAALKATPEELKTITTKFEGDCNSRPWTKEQKTCVMGMKDVLLDKPCFKGLDVAQMVHDTAQEIKAAREAAGGGSAAAGGGGAIEAGSAAPAGSGSAAPTP